MFLPTIPNGKVPIARKIDARLYVGPIEGLPLGPNYTLTHPGEVVNPGTSDAYTWLDSSIVIKRDGRIAISRKTDNFCYDSTVGMFVFW